MVATTESLAASRILITPAAPSLMGPGKTRRNCWSGAMPVALLLGRKALAMAESTVNVALLLTTVPTLLLTTTEKTAPLSTPVGLASVYVELVALLIGLPFLR